MTEPPFGASMTSDYQCGYRLNAWGEEPVWVKMPQPRAGADEVLVQVEACGVGLTVLNALAGDLADKRAGLPVVPGHEIVGRVVGAGSQSRRAEALVGRRIVAYFYLSCGLCPECTDANESRCRSFGGFLGVHRDGGYAPYVALPVLNAIPVPDELDPVAATVVPDAVATPVHICRSRLSLRPHDRVLVLGAGGGVGMHMVQVANLYGARVAGLEVREDKLSVLEEMGVLPVRSGTFSQLDPSKIWPDGAPTVVIDFVGSNESLCWSIEALAPGGSLVLLTTFSNRELKVDPRQAVLREIAVLGSRYASRAEVSLAADLVLSGRVRPIIGMQSSADGLLDIHDHLRAGTLLGRGALCWKP
jgi:D-arabinose 1-dehydrogenase-like Zn-dependent alcohol dehydrogenase